jgi:hypothetical protein
MTPASTMRGRHAARGWLLTSAIVALLGAAAGYLYDPPWVGGTTMGFRTWETEGPGIRFRWTGGHATFYVPRDATLMTLPLRSQFGGPGDGPVSVSVSVDDRLLTDIVLDDPDAWVRSIVPLPRRATRRRFRRVDLRVSRTVGEPMFGVMVGEIALDGANAGR